MDFKIDIWCNKCKCHFEFRPDNFKSRTTVECPNCGQLFPEDVYANLKTGIIALGSVPEATYDENPFASSKDEGFKLKVKSYDLLEEYGMVKE